MEGRIVEHRGEVEWAEELVEDVAVLVLRLLLLLLREHSGLLEKIIVERRILPKEVVHKVASSGERISRPVIAAPAPLLALALVRDLLLLLRLGMLWEWAPKLITLQICVAEVFSSVPDLGRPAADASLRLTHLRHSAADVLSSSDGYLWWPEVFFVLHLGVSDVCLSVTVQLFKHTDALGGFDFFHIVEGNWFLD